MLLTYDHRVLEDWQLVIGVHLQLREAQVLVTVGSLGLVGLTYSLLILLESLVVQEHLHIFFERRRILARG